MLRALTAYRFNLFLTFLISLAGCGRSDFHPADGGMDGDVDVLPSCTNAAECDDGDPCNGTESCVDGQCQPGAAVSCDDGVECTADTCDSVTGECVSLSDHERCALGELCDPETGCLARVCSSSEECDDEHFCNGSEFCSGGLCQGGTPPVCNDGIGCTIDRCDDEVGRCVVTLDDSACVDLRFCNGRESCDATLGCRPGTPVECDDGDRCTLDSCDEGSRSCRYEPRDSDGDSYAACGCAPSPCDCDDNDVTVNPGMTEQCRDLRDNDCDGLEDCDDREDCGHDPRCGPAPCEGPEDCDDGQYCNGQESCVDGACQEGTPPSCADPIACTVDSCDEFSDRCRHDPDHSLCDVGLMCDAEEGCVERPCDDDFDCDDDQFCNGAEICGPAGACLPGTEVACNDAVDCTVDSCDELLDRCVARPDHALCSNDVFCDGVEQCVAHEGGCVPGDEPCGESDPCETVLCDEQTQSCMGTIRDADQDGFPPEECGGRDCDDGNPLINPRATEVCDDIADNDCNGRRDCDDPSCSQHPACCIPTGPEVCDDGVDNDCDRHADCDDRECTSDPACCTPTGPEECTDGADNDCDGLTDCSDEEDCGEHGACDDCIAEVCWDGEDNDCDEDVDCGDSDCDWYPPCTAPTEEIDCTNGVDDDLDGLTDCDDPDCDDFPLCPYPDNCTDAQLVEGQSATVVGTTTPMRHDYFPDTSEPGCRGGRGPDAVYYIVLEETAEVHIDTYGSDFDTVLYVRQGHCTSGPQVACNDDTMDYLSEVHFVADPGYYFIFVDGFGRGSSGDYQLNILIEPQSDEICDNGRDDDGDRRIDCDDSDCDNHPHCLIRPERGVDACTDGRDNDGDNLVDCEDTEDCAVADFLGECCDGVDENFNDIVDEFACACDWETPCEQGVCYWDSFGACGPECYLLGGDAFCQWIFPDSTCDFDTGTCNLF